MIEKFNPDMGWSENLGYRPVGIDTLVDIKLNCDNDIYKCYKAKDFNWSLYLHSYITHWRLHEQSKSEQQPQKVVTLDDALGEQKATCFAEAFDAMAESQWEGTYKYPETTYEPLPVQPSQNALVASVFNTLYPEPCALREVHVEALKAIMKLVDERGGE